MAEADGRDDVDGLARAYRRLAPGVVSREPSVQLRRVWADVPEVGCKGLCADYCGPVYGSDEERALAADRGVMFIEPAKTLFQAAFGAPGSVSDCPALVDGRCSIYEVRPMVCRVWGATEDLPCPHGCIPDEGRLSYEDGARLMQRAQEVGQLRSRAERRRGTSINERQAHG